MARNLLPIRILFHTIYAFVYLPIIGLGFTWGLSDSAWGWMDGPFFQNHYDGFVSLTALVGLGVFAILDFLTIRRKVNQCAFLAIEIFVAVLLPLSMWPIILSCLYISWPTPMAQLDNAMPWFANIYLLIGIPISQDTFTAASLISATVAILGLNITFVSYICITAIMDKVRGNKFLPTYPGESSLLSAGPRERRRLFGTQRTPTERAAVVRHCADYIFRHSVFRKHAFEPPAWAILRGVIAGYSCIGILVFSAYSGYIEFQLHLNRAYTVNDAVLGSTSCVDVISNFNTTSVTANMTSPDDMFDDPFTLGISNFEQVEWGTWWDVYNSSDSPTPAGFEIGWTGNYSLLLWVTMSNTIGFANSTQVSLTSPFTLAPFKHYTISLSMMKYMLGSLWFISYRPDVITSVDSASRSNTSVATFSFDRYCQAIIQRQLSPPSIFPAIAHVLSDIGGTLAFIDGVFTLVFGRTIMGIIFGTRIVSPFGMLAMVTRSRFKRLIHDQFPRMQEDIERGGMAAYISEVAIDAALIGPCAKGHPTLPQSSRVGDETGEGTSVDLRPMQVGTSASYLRLPYVVEELGDVRGSLSQSSHIGDEAGGGDAIELGRLETVSSTSGHRLPSVGEELEDTESSPLIDKRVNHE